MGSTRTNQQAQASPGAPHAYAACSSAPALAPSGHYCPHPAGPAVDLSGADMTQAATMAQALIRTAQEAPEALTPICGPSLREETAECPESVRTIPLTKGYVAVVDNADYGFLSGFRWLASKARIRGAIYAQRSPCHGEVKMHRVILNAPPGLEVDHLDGDGLNNRRSNLRLVTRKANSRNGHRRTPTKHGLPVGTRRAWHSSTFTAQIMIDGKNLYLGSFATPAEAHAAYLAARERSIQAACTAPACPLYAYRPFQRD